MELVSVKGMLDKALKENYAVGHFDVHNLEWVQSVLEAAEELNSPVILGVTEEAIDYFGGFSVAKELVISVIREKDITVPIALHLDHGSSLENCKSAIQAGFFSVMLDASKLTFYDNVMPPKEVVDSAHKLGVTVEAELGSIGGKEGEIVSDVPVYADIDECIQLVTLTKINSLAPALGSAHGPYKGEPKVDFKKMKKISESIQIPLVLHGASGLYPEQIQQAILSGTAKINVNADNHLAFTKRVRQLLNENRDMYDATRYIREGRMAVKEMVKEKIRLFGSSGKA